MPPITVHDVIRLALPPGTTAVAGSAGLLHQVSWVATPRATKDCATMLQDLRKDPSLRFTESGRGLLRWLDAKVTGLPGLRDMVVHAPPHCKYFIAGLARRCAEEWLELAMQLEDQLDKAE